MRVDSVLEDEELARTALSCHFSMDLMWQEMSVEYIDIARRTNTNLDVLLESHFDDKRDVDGG